MSCSTHLDFVFQFLRFGFKRTGSTKKYIYFSAVANLACKCETSCNLHKCFFLKPMLSVRRLTAGSKKTNFKITSFLAALLNLSKNTVSKRKAKDHKISLVRQNTMHDRSLLWHHAYVQLELDDIIVIT